MRSVYQRQFLFMASIVLISFALLGCAFIALSYRYTVQENQSTLATNAQYISTYTGTMRQLDPTVLSTTNFQRNIAALANVSGLSIILAETDGKVVYGFDGATNTFLQGDAALPSAIVSSVTSGHSYSGMFSISGLYEKARYGVGYPISWVEDGQTGIGGIVLVSSDTGNLTEMWRVLAQIFFFTAVVVFILAFIASSITSARQAKPLHEMAQAVHKFGHGEFDTRLTGYEGRRDEIGELAAAFNSMADSLSRSEARRSEFVANVSHELKTPMTTIAGFADGILDGTIPPERERECLQVISTETRRLSRLVRRMLDLSRLEAADRSAAQGQFNVTEVMLRVLVSLEPKVNSRQLDVDADLPDNPVMVWGDPDGITQVCYNLLDNAVKFASPGSVIGIKVAASAGKARVSVRNQGETIPKEELSMLFDRFHKTDRSRSMDRDGVGLGLYIVKSILDAHKEDITVTSQDGVTEFTFTLTLA